MKIDTNGRVRLHTALSPSHMDKLNILSLIKQINKRKLLEEILEYYWWSRPLELRKEMDTLIKIIKNWHLEKEPLDDEHDD